MAAMVTTTVAKLSLFKPLTSAKTQTVLQALGQVGITAGKGFAAGSTLELTNILTDAAIMDALGDGKSKSEIALLYAQRYGENPDTAKLNTALDVASRAALARVRGETVFHNQRLQSTRNDTCGPHKRSGMRTCFLNSLHYILNFLDSKLIFKGVFKMTGMGLLKIALAILGKDPDDTDDYEAAALIHINTLLADLFDVNNSILTAGGGAALAEIPLLTLGMSDDLDDIDVQKDAGYADMLARNVMPWGLARLIGAGESFRNIGYVANTYEENKLKAAVYNDGTITDVYSDLAVEEEEEA
jgi:hypothetical protein